MADRAGQEGLRGGSRTDPAGPLGVMAAPTRLEVTKVRVAARRKRARRGSTFHHYTVNFGTYKELPRGPLSRRTADTLWDLVQRGGGSFAGVLSAFACRIEPGIEPGGRVFWILRNGDPVFLCVACWEVCYAAGLFGVAERAYYELLLHECVSAPSESSVEHAPGRPGRLPWLARVQFPGLQQLGARESIVLDELERCLAWTLITRLPVSR